MVNVVGALPPQSRLLNKRIKLAGFIYMLPAHPAGFMTRLRPPRCVGLSLIAWHPNASKKSNTQDRSPEIIIKALHLQQRISKSSKKPKTSNYIARQLSKSCNKDGFSFTIRQAYQQEQPKTFITKQNDAQGRICDEEFQ